MHSPSNGIRILGIVCLVLAVAVPLISQTTTGRILGTVRDQSGAALPAATVTVTDVQRGITRTVTTDDSGEYVVPNLTPGIYTVRAESRGLRPMVSRLSSVRIFRSKWPQISPLTSRSPRAM